MHLKISLISFIMFCCISVLGSKEYRYDYTYVPIIDGWIKVNVFPATWDNASLRCYLEGAVLASPETPELASTLQSIAAERFPCGMYTGVHSTFAPGDYFSIDGTPIERMPIEWAPNEPDNHEGIENIIILQGNGTAADVKHTDVYPYVCYRRGPVTLNECGSVDPEYRYEARTGSCYKFHRVGANWTRAFTTCAAEGAYLAIINSQLEAVVLTEIYAKYPDAQINGKVRNVAHIGFKKIAITGTWMTIHGQSIEAAGYSKFDNGQPDSPNFILCGGMFRNGGLDDIDCANIAPFICEKSPDSLKKKNMVSKNSL